MKTVVMAYQSIGYTGVAALIRNGFEIQAIFTYKDAPDERLWSPSVAALAAEHNIPVYTPNDINHSIWVEKIRQLQPDVIFSFYYRDILKKPILDIPARGCINLHGSLLPKYRGRAPVNWALIKGEKETGATLHYMTENVDAGDIIGQCRFRIDDNDTAFTVQNKLAENAAHLLDKYLPDIKAGNVVRIPQNLEQSCCYGRRGPDDGLINWHQSNIEIHNLVRAVTHPYPGAFTFKQQNKLYIWKTRLSTQKSTGKKPGTILSTSPLLIACGSGALEIISAQSQDGIIMSGAQIAATLNLCRDGRLHSAPLAQSLIKAKTRVLILGVNGFIGNALSERLLESGDYEVHGMDIHNNAVQRFADHPDFYFHEGDISIHNEWIEYHVKKCDIVIPLVAIATPIEYTRNPINVFELDFEENLRIVRYCVKYKKRIIFPSTSEVYGMCEEEEFDEDQSRLVLGPINKQRWIYSCCKQLLDRIIWAYGKTNDLKFTLFRPFNWIGPRLDTLDSARIGSSRAITQLILNLVEGTPIQLIDGGAQKRCFTDISDGVECLFRIIENKNNACDGQIINIGNPVNELSIRALAENLVSLFDKHPLRDNFPEFAGMHKTESHAYYGEGYEDVQYRRPSIRNARRLLDWQPETSIQESIMKTLDYFLYDYQAPEEAASDETKISSVPCNVKKIAS